MKVISKLILLVGITATAFCTKDAAVIPFNGTWTITNIDSKIIYNNGTSSNIVANDWFKQNDSNLYVIQYKWYIDSNSLVVKDKDIVVGEFILAHKPTDSIGIQYVSNRSFNRAPWFQYKQINRTLILDVDLYYDNVCGVYIPNALKRHLTLTLTK
jgi:hypothetical protein